MHRSGTSLIAEMVHRWGASGRVSECLPSNCWNQHGYWELEPLVSLNNRLLEEVGASWSFPPSLESELQLAELADHGSYREEALGLLTSMNSDGKAKWFWKDPRLCILLPFWQRIWGRPRYVICVRDPIEICNSLQIRDDLSLPVSIMLWQCYMLATLEGTRDSSVLFMNYSEVLKNPAHECARLAKFLGNHSKAARISREMRKAVDGKLRHCQAQSACATVSLTRSQSRLWETLKELASPGGAGGTNLEGCSLPTGWRNLLRLNYLMLKCKRRWRRWFPVVELESEPVALNRALH
jgi:hypothetical protein